MVVDSWPGLAQPNCVLMGPIRTNFWPSWKQNKLSGPIRLYQVKIMASKPTKWKIFSRTNIFCSDRPFLEDLGNPLEWLAISAWGTGTSMLLPNLDTKWQSSSAAWGYWTNEFHWLPMLLLHAYGQNAFRQSSGGRIWCCQSCQRDRSAGRYRHWSSECCCGACKVLRTAWSCQDLLWNWVQADLWGACSNWSQMQIESCRICYSHLEVLLLHMSPCAEHCLELARRMMEDLLDLEHSPWTYQLRRVLPLKSSNLFVEFLEMLTSHLLVGWSLLSWLR